MEEGGKWKEESWWQEAGLGGDEVEELRRRFMRAFSFGKRCKKTFFSPWLVSLPAFARAFKRRNGRFLFFSYCCCLSLRHVFTAHVGTDGHINWKHEISRRRRRCRGCRLRIRDARCQANVSFVSSSAQLSNAGQDDEVEVGKNSMKSSSAAINAVITAVISRSTCHRWRAE